MKISVITVSYNAAATIEQTIQSVLSQSYTNVEYIVIDGASSDNTLQIIEKYKTRIAHVVSEKDGGIYDAMNKGIALATGDIVGILNSDDLYHNEDVLSFISTQFEDSSIDCVCTDVEIFSETPNNVIRYYNCRRWKPWMFRIGHQPPHPGFFVRRNVYAEVGNFNTQYRLAADFDFLLRCILKYKKPTRFINYVSVSMRSGGASQKSFKNIQRANSEVHHSLKRNGYFSIPLLVWLKYPFKIFQFFLK